MKTSGRSHSDKVMALIPIGVLLFVTIVLLGGPEAFLQTVDQTLTEVSVRVRALVNEWR